jgi:hypothetical protein
MYAWSASLSSKAQTVVGIHRGLACNAGRLPSQGRCTLGLVIGFFVGELELRRCRSALRYDLFMLKQLWFAPNAAVGVIVSGFTVPETFRCTDFFDDGRGRIEPAPVILPIASSCDAAKFGRRQRAFPEALVLKYRAFFARIGEQPEIRTNSSSGGNCMTSPGVSRGRAVSCLDTIRCPNRGLSL